MMRLTKHITRLTAAISLAVLLGACGSEISPWERTGLQQNTEVANTDDDWQAAVADAAGTVTVTDQQGFVWRTEQFADIQILRYQVPGWDKLTLNQKKLAYYLTQAGLAGRDIMWDQNYRLNLALRKLLETIYKNYNRDRHTLGWQRFETYLKRIWFANGMHHHYSMMKFRPEFSRKYFQEIADSAGVEVSTQIMDVMFEPGIDAKKVELDTNKGLLEHSAVNFYAPDVTTAEAQAFYRDRIDQADPTPISYGLNSRLAKNSSGQIYEQTWKLGGMYTNAISAIIGWLEKAVTVAENQQQAQALQTLIEYYRTGDLALWDKYNILWTAATGGDVDYINGFVEVYNDPLGYRGSYETIVEIKDFDSSARMKVLMSEAGWFERHSPIMDRHKRQDVVGITYNVVNVVGESGDSSPSTPVGVNLPNANWIRATHGSKSISLGNIENAYREATGSLLVDEFANDEREKEWDRNYGTAVDALHTALHEVIGHASGRLEPGIGEPRDTLKNYASTIEEGRADLTALYFMLDPQMVTWGLLPSLDAGKSGYDGYLRNGLLTQLRRIEPGADIEESHMRNRAWICRWVLEHGRPDDVVVENKRDGKTYYDIQDYQRLRDLFGRLLREVQRIKSQGDYQAARELVETYGVKVDPEIHREVLARAERLHIAPFSGFINPRLQPVTDEQGNMIDIRIDYPDDFARQMLNYSDHYSTL